MADSTVRQDGSGDFTTFAAALADAGTVAGDKVTIEDAWTIDDTAAATIDALDDTITVEIDLANTSYHDGVYDESNEHYRLVISGAHALTVNGTGCVIDGLAIVQAGVGVSDECIRLGVATTTTVRNLIVKANTNTSDQDGIFAANSNMVLNAENVIAYDFGRAAFHIQAVNASTYTFNLNSCTARNCSRNAGEADGGGMGVFRSSAGATSIMNIFNCPFLECNVSGASDDYNESGVNGTATWNIDYSISSDSSITSRDAGAVGALENRTSTDNPSPGVGDFVIFKDITTAIINLLLQDNATDNDAQDAHSATSGAGLTLPILDITAEVRDRDPNMIDIGADEAELTPSTPGLPEYGQLRTAIGDPAVYGATIFRS